MTQPLSEWLQEVKARLEEMAVMKARVDAESTEKSNFQHWYAAQLRFHYARQTFDAHAPADLARAVEELEKPAVVTDEMVERAAKAAYEFDWRGSSYEKEGDPRLVDDYRKWARVALEAALRPTP